MKHTLTLADLQQKHVNALRANNRSDKTITHYTDSFKDLVKFLTAEGLPPLLDSLTTDSCQRYVVWLRETPIQEMCQIWDGGRCRSPARAA